MKTLEELNQELSELKTTRRKVLVDRNAEWEKRYPSLAYRFSHDAQTGRSTLPQWAFLIMVMTVATLVMGVSMAGWFVDVGDVNYHLETDRVYECQFCQWEGNVSQMFYHDGVNGVVYYCPECGEVIGIIPYDQQQG